MPSISAPSKSAFRHPQNRHFGTLKIGVSRFRTPFRQITSRKFEKFSEPFSLANTGETGHRPNYKPRNFAKEVARPFKRCLNLLIGSREPTIPLNPEEDQHERVPTHHTSREGR